MKRKLLYIFILLVLSVIGVSVFFITPRNLDAFAEEYDLHCSSCHGEEFLPPERPSWERDMSYSQVFDAIKYGRNDLGMRSFDSVFSNSQMKRMAKYIVHLKEQQRFSQHGLPIEWPDTIESADLRFTLDTIAVFQGEDSTRDVVPWGLAFLPGGGILITERSGTLFHFKANGNMVQVAGVPDVHDWNKGGLLDVEADPEFSDNQYIYFTYALTKKKQFSSTAVMRARLQNDSLTSKEIILEALPHVRWCGSFGSRLAFDSSQNLYVSFGDAYVAFGGAFMIEDQQSLSNHHGKVHRIGKDGSIPDDNPFLDTEDAVPSTYSYGHRNPQGLTVNPFTGSIWSAEHGPRGGDEVNMIRPGANYGWPVITYGVNYNGTKITDLTEKEGMEQPEKYWVPSIAPCGMDFVSGDNYPAWKGDLLVASMKFKYIERLKMEGDSIVGSEQLLKEIGRVRDIQMGPDNYLYILVQGNPAYAFRVNPLADPGGRGE